MSQRTWGKLADQTSAVATQLTVSLPTANINPAIGSATTGMSLASLEYIVVVSITNAAVALTQGVTIFGNDWVNTIPAPGAECTVYAIPTAGTTPQAYFYGISAGTNDSTPAGQSMGFGAPVWDKMTIQATPGAASTVRLIVYGVHSLF